MNEIASDDELDSEPVEAANTAEALLRANISQKVAIISGRSTFWSTWPAYMLYRWVR